MKLLRVVKGKTKVSMPLCSVDSGGGWSSVAPDEPGILVKLSPQESDGVFITDSALKELGYHFRRPQKRKTKIKEGARRTVAKARTRRRK